MLKNCALQKNAVQPFEIITDAPKSPAVTILFFFET